MRRRRRCCGPRGGPRGGDSSSSAKSSRPPFSWKNPKMKRKSWNHCEIVDGFALFTLFHAGHSLLLKRIEKMLNFNLISVLFGNVVWHVEKAVFLSSFLWKNFFSFKGRIFKRFAASLRLDCSVYMNGDCEWFFSKNGSSNWHCWRAESVPFWVQNKPFLTENDENRNSHLIGCQECRASCRECRIWLLRNRFSCQVDQNGLFQYWAFAHRREFVATLQALSLFTGLNEKRWKKVWSKILQRFLKMKWWQWLWQLWRQWQFKKWLFSLKKWIVKDSHYLTKFAAFLPESMTAVLRACDVWWNLWAPIVSGRRVPWFHAMFTTKKHFFEKLAFFMFSVWSLKKVWEMKKFKQLFACEIKRSIRKRGSVAPFQLFTKTSHTPQRGSFSACVQLHLMSCQQRPFRLSAYHGTIDEFVSGGVWAGGHQPAGVWDERGPHIWFLQRLGSNWCGKLIAEKCQWYSHWTFLWWGLGQICMDCLQGFGTFLTYLSKFEFARKNCWKHIHEVGWVLGSWIKLNFQFELIIQGEELMGLGSKEFFLTCEKILAQCDCLKKKFSTHSLKVFVFAESVWRVFWLLVAPWCTRHFNPFLNFLLLFFQRLLENHFLKNFFEKFWKSIFWKKNHVVRRHCHGSISNAEGMLKRHFLWLFSVIVSVLWFSFFSVCEKMWSLFSKPWLNFFLNEKMIAFVFTSTIFSQLFFDKNLSLDFFECWKKKTFDSQCFLKGVFVKKLGAIRCSFLFCFQCWKKCEWKFFVPKK